MFMHYAHEDNLNIRYQHIDLLEMEHPKSLQELLRRSVISLLVPLLPLVAASFARKNICKHEQAVWSPRSPLGWIGHIRVLWLPFVQARSNTDCGEQTHAASALWKSVKR